MQTKHVVIISILLASNLIPHVSNADSTMATNPISPSMLTITPDSMSTVTSSDEASKMSKTLWLESITPMLPALICKGFMNQKEITEKLDSIKMTNEKCLSAMSESVTKCHNQINPIIPETITSADAAIWGKTLGDCIGKDFAMKYLISK